MAISDRTIPVTVTIANGATIRDGGATALAAAINGTATATIRDGGAASGSVPRGPTSGGTDRAGGATSGAGLPPQ